MKSAINKANEVKNVQNSATPKNDAVMVLSMAEEPTKVTPVAEKHALPGKEKTEEVKAKIEDFAPSADERIKRAENFGILSTKYIHLKMKAEEMEKFILASDGTKEKLVLENSLGMKIEVNNSMVIKGATSLLSKVLQELRTETEQEIKAFVI